MVHLVDGVQLLERARQAHVRARSKEATPRDMFLVYGDPEAKPSTHSNGVRELTGPQSQQLQKDIATATRLQKLNGEGSDEWGIRRIRSVQRSDCMTDFSDNSVDAGCYLPGGAPLIDHLCARLEHLPDWQCLVPAVERLRNHRLPDIARPASQREFTLGSTPERHVQVTLEFLKDHVKQSKSFFIICMLAADTESINVVKEDYTMMETGTLGETFTFRVAKLGESAKALPVVLMVGHVGWQVHVKLPVTSTRDAKGRRTLKMEPGELQESVLPFFNEIGEVTGVDVEDDLTKFFLVVQKMFGVNLWRHKIKYPLELSRLARVAGYNLTRYGVEVLNWICFGTLLAKGWVSKGDGKWDLPWDELTVPFRSYMAGDIGQCAGAANVLWYLLIIRIFPDPHAVQQLSSLTPQLLLEWCVTYLGRNISLETKISPWEAADTMATVWDLLVDEDEEGKQVRGLFPTWPAVTSGGARYTHAARAFLLKSTPALNAIDELTWPLMPGEIRHLVMFNRHQFLDQPVPTDPTANLGWVHNPGLTGTLERPAADITHYTITQLTGDGVGMKGLLLELIRVAPSEGRDLMARLESGKRVAASVMGCREKAERVVPVLRAMLSVCNHMLPRPEGWEDMYREEEAVAKKVARISKQAKKVIKHTKLGMAKMALLRGHMEHALEASKRKKCTQPDRTWALLRAVAPTNRCLSPFAPDRRATVGERPNRKRERTSEAASGQSSTRSTKRSRHRQPSIESSDLMAMLRRVVQTDRGTPCRDEAGVQVRHVSYVRSSSPSAPMPAAANVVPRGEIADGSRAIPQVLTPQGLHVNSVPRESVQPTGVFLVGCGHARRAMTGLVRSVIDAPSVIIPVADWTAAAVAAAVTEIGRYDLTGGLVILWLFDELAFEEQETGQLLSRDRYDGRFHCEGPLGVASWRSVAPLLEDAAPLIRACRGAARIVLMGPLPIYLSIPCCEDSSHCVGYLRESLRLDMCRGVKLFHEAIVRWVSWLDQQNVFVVCPHEELMEDGRLLGEDAMSFLVAAYSYDGVHLSATSYRDLLDRMMLVLDAHSWQYRPTRDRMPDPGARSAPGRSGHRDPPGRRGGYALPAGIEVLVDTFRVDSPPRAYTAESERSARRTMWRPEQRRGSESPPISPGFWASVRATAPPANRPRGGCPE